VWRDGDIKTDHVVSFDMEYSMSVPLQIIEMSTENVLCTISTLSVVSAY